MYHDRRQNKSFVTIVTCSFFYILTLFVLKSETHYVFTKNKFTTEIFVYNERINL